MGSTGAPCQLVRKGRLTGMLGHVPNKFFLSGILVAIVCRGRRLCIRCVPVAFQPERTKGGSVGVGQVVGVKERTFTSFVHLQNEV